MQTEVSPHIKVFLKEEGAEQEKERRICFAFLMELRIQTSVSSVFILVCAK